MDITSNGNLLRGNHKNRTQMTQIKQKCHSEQSEESCFLDSSGFALRMTAKLSSVKSVFHFALILIFMFILEGSSFSQSEPPPRITVTPKQVNLGVMKKDEVKLYKIIVGNKGKGNLYITNIPSPNEKTGVPLNKNAIKPGKKVELTFFYRGIDTGIIKDYVSIESNDPKNPYVKIILKGEVK